MIDFKSPQTGGQDKVKLTVARCGPGCDKAILSLFNRQSWVHRHLDWRTLPEWLEDPDTCLVSACYGDHRLVGALGITPKPAAWIRMIAIAQNVPRLPLLKKMLQSAENALIGDDVKDVNIFPSDRWIEAYLHQLGFRTINAVVNLCRFDEPPNPMPVPGVTLRPVQAADIEAVADVDRASFEPIWQHNADDLRAAARIADYFTLAEHDGQAVGYQLTTMHTGSAHLARLAVIPAARRRGIGYALIADMLWHFAKRGFEFATVNTQADNHASLSLYKRLDFDLQPYRVNVWSKALTR